MVRHRVTLRFRSDSGREYLYDDATGSIFPWGEARESALESEIEEGGGASRAAPSARCGTAELEAARRFIDHWKSDYGAFTREWDETSWRGAPEAGELEAYIRNASFELLLVLTENCNLRCGYCALSKVYPLSRARSTRKMSAETARRAIDWYAALVRPQMRRNPRKRFGLSFYGGEPMMNMPVLRAALEYCRARHPSTFLPVMTTNGTLLTRENAAVLVEHDVMLAISIDGPPGQHDRLRTDARGRGTCGKVLENLRRMRDDYPEYWKAKVTSVSVYDWGTDLEETEAFFERNSGLIPRTVFVNPVAPRNTCWYERYGEVERTRTMTAMERLRERYKAAKIENRATGHYLNSLVGIDISMVLLRRRAGDARPAFAPFSGACVPGSKLAVQVDGSIDMCERVNGTYPIGHLGAGGVDYQRLRAIIEEYRREILSRCPQCPATKHCNICFAAVEKRGGFRRDEGLCAATIDSARRRMADYVSILEKNARADFQFETDTSRLEERMLFQY